MNKPNNVHCFCCLGPPLAFYNKFPARNQICIKSESKVTLNMFASELKERQFRRY